MSPQGVLDDSDVADLLALIDEGSAVVTKASEPSQDDEMALVAELVREVDQRQSDIVGDALAEIHAEEIKTSIYRRQAEKLAPIDKVNNAPTGDLRAYPDVAEAFAQSHSAEEPVVAQAGPVVATQPVPKARRARSSRKRASTPATPSFDVGAALNDFARGLADLGLAPSLPHPITHPITGALATDEDVAVVAQIQNQKQRKAILNLLATLAGRDKLYVYTRYAVEILSGAPSVGVAKDEFRSLFEVMTTRSGGATLAASTAHSQAEKYWKVLPALRIGIMTPDGRMTFNTGAEIKRLLQPQP